MSERAGSISRCLDRKTSGFQKAAEKMARRAVVFNHKYRVHRFSCAFRPTAEHGTPPSVLRCELAAVGYREISLDRLGGANAYLAIFAPPSVASRTRPETIAACKSP
jgi:hypothetical protein